MKLEELTPAVLEQLETVRFDRFSAQYEGLWDYKWWLKEEGAEFLQAAEHWVLLPTESRHWPHITFERVIESRDRRTLTLFGRDATFAGTGSDEDSTAGFLAVCEKFPGQEFFVATFYHDRYLIEPLSN